MNASLKSTVESALVALLAAASCLWFLISAADSADPAASRVALLALGLAASLAAHWAFMGILVKRSGRSLWLWLPLLVIFMPVGTAVLLALIVSSDKESALPGSAPSPEA
ncbi:hypothetical protein HNP55_004309 [Paucibacter oligotrophus]|uniref:Uncharacterized protein n=1 Tax=Roseateles oligotrophus TaxID=1769250 RepID=A0A840LKF2_9BURK|nr:hypothetical protein [Roseateles oligotrophus]MBB4845757.1 hypothetical protein [Roseateles oligotrophus]